MVRKCLHCGKEFETDSPWLKMCSKECQDERRKAQVRKYSKARYFGNTKIYQEDQDKKKARDKQNIDKNKRACQKAKAREWLAKYNSTGKHGGDKMFAEELGITYEEWCKIPLDQKFRMREKVLREKRWQAK